MIDVLSTLQGVLREAGFTTRLVSIDRFSVVCFEDDALVGFGVVFGDPDELLEQWKATEISLLGRFAPVLRAAGDKAWNVYCAFLCGADAAPGQNRQVRAIEEDLERTRKVAACGLATREDLVRVLLPVLPLQYQPALRPEDVTERLLRRIRTIAPRASDAALDAAMPPAEVVRLLGDPV